MQCPLCNTPLANRLDEVYFDCSHCRGIVMDETLRFDSSKEREHYAAHNNDVYDAGYRQFTKPVWEYVLHNCSKNDFGLDFGCGSGPVITEILREEGYKLALYDPYFADDKTALKHKYNYIFSCEVVEHFYYPNKEFELLSNLLLSNGVLIIMTHLFSDQDDFSRWYYRKDKTHVFIYRQETIRYIARRYNLQLLHMDERLVLMVKGGVKLK